MNVKLIIIILLVWSSQIFAQNNSDSTKVYKKRVLENTEVDLLMSYYNQAGDNAAVSGGIGNEKLNDIAPTIIVSVPLSSDDVLTLDAGISAYSSASSSNIDPFDGKGGAIANPFQASSGASSIDGLFSGSINYSHSSDSRNNVYSGKISFGNEFDYTSIGFGGGFTKLFNEKNTEINISANAYIDRWRTVYPIELRPFENNGSGLNNRLFRQNTITGNQDYNPAFSVFDKKSRNSFSVGFNFSQILSKRMQGSISLDLVQQQGLLSTPFHRVYFADIEDSYIEEFQLADDIERLPNKRFKTAIGGRLNYYISEMFTLRTFYRYYSDEWGIKSNTASIELPIKITDKFTLYPSYRYYDQSAADYFGAYETHVSTEEFYTSDYDLSKYNSNQYGFGISYTDIFNDINIYKLGLKSIDLKYNHYTRDSGLKANLFNLGVKFVIE